MEDLFLSVRHQVALWRSRPFAAVIIVLVGASLLALPATTSADRGSDEAAPARKERSLNGPVVVEGDRGQRDLFVLGPGGAVARRLTTSPGRDERDPAWSPDGRRVAFWRIGGQGADAAAGSAWVMRADGARKTRLTPDEVDARQPSWSPDGTRLVVSLHEARGERTDDLVVLEAADGTVVRRLTSGPAKDYDPAWSPDGRRIAFSRAPADEGDLGNLIVLTLRPGLEPDVKRITDTPAKDSQVAWAPGGRRLVFQRATDPGTSLFSIRPDGSGVKRLTRGEHRDLAPTFSPDGDEIVFRSDRDAARQGLWLVRSDGNGLRRFAAPNTALANPDWAVRQR